MFGGKAIDQGRISSAGRCFDYSRGCTKLDPTFMNSNACDPSRLANSLQTIRDLQNKISFTSEEEKQIRVSVVGLRAQQ